MSLPFHPLANLFPLIEGADFEQLVASVKEHGLREPVVIQEGLILDGRNRFRALSAAGLIDAAVPLADQALRNPRWFRRFRPEKEGEALAFVLDRNLQRRHLNESQRAFVAANIAGFTHGGDRRPEQAANLPLVKQAEAAAMVHVSERSVRSAVAVRDKGSVSLQRAVAQGKLPVSVAAKAAELRSELQEKVVREAEAGRANVVRLVIKQENRAVRERELGAKQTEAPQGQFGVIVEDFEWDFQTRSEAGQDRAAANHYEVATDAHSPEEIVARTADRFAVAADDCVLFMCATNPHLAIALEVMKLRGFKYVSNYVLEKNRIITGYWSRGKHEMLLIGVKGKPPCPAPGTQWASVIPAPVGKHSAKPPAFLEMIESYFPTLPKLELNRRGPARPGWAAWGNEVDPPVGEDRQTNKAHPIAGDPSQQRERNVADNAQTKCETESA